MSNLWDRCRDAIVQRIASLPLAGTIASRIYKQKLPDVATIELPAILVTLEGCSEQVDLLDTGTDETTYPVAVHILDRQDRRDQAGQARWTGWRETLSTAWRARGLDGVPEVWRMDVRTMSVLDAQRSAGPAYQFATGSFLVRCRCLTGRITY